MSTASEIHILYVITKLELGGAQKVCLSLQRGVPLEKEYQTSLIAGAGGVLDATVSDSSSVYLLPSLRREVRFTAFLYELKAFGELTRFMRELKKQFPRLIVHTHSTKAGLLGRWAAFFARIPVRVHTIHGFAFHAHQGWLPWLLLCSLEWITSIITTHFVTVSSADVQMARRLFPRFSKKNTMIRAAIEWDRFKAAVPLVQKRAQRPFIFGTVACFKPQKNLFDLLRAFHAAYQRSTDIRCEIIGDGEQRPEIEAWIAQNKLGNVITLHGWQSDVAPIMAQWHAFVLTSLWEGLPCAVVEARLLQLPVLSYRTGGISDVIKPQLNGMLYTPKKWQTLAQDMHRIAHDPAWYHLLSAHRDSLDEFKDQTMIERHRELYRRLM